MRKDRRLLTVEAKPMTNPTRPYPSTPSSRAESSPIRKLSARLRLLVLSRCALLRTTRPRMGSSFRNIYDWRLTIFDCRFWILDLRFETREHTDDPVFAPEERRCSAGRTARMERMCAVFW